MSEDTAPDWGASALVTIDLQQDFALAEGSAHVPGTEAIAPAVGRLAAAFRAAGRPIVHAVRYYLPDGSNAEIGRRQRVREAGPVVAPGSPGAELAEAIRPAGYGGLNAAALMAGDLQPLGPQEWAMFKPRWSAFFRTGLHERLQELGVTTVVVAGCNLPNCPRATLFDASSLDYRAAVVRDAISQVEPGRLFDLALIDVETVTLAEAEATLAGFTAAAPPGARP